MADLAVIALGLDASGMKAGADVASRALTQTEKDMDALQKRLDALQANLKQGGQAAGDSAKKFKDLGGSAKDSGAALSAFGGPVGDVTGQIVNLSSTLTGLISELGVFGGIAAGAVAGVVGLAGAFAKLALDGVKLSDTMGDLAEGTGFTIDQVQRLAAAETLAGEPIEGLEQSYRKFQGVIQAALDDPASKAVTTVKRLGLQLDEASKDTAGAFLQVVANLGDLRKTTEGAVATNEALGRQVGALTRTSADYQVVLKASTDDLVRWGLIAGKDAVDAGQKLDKQINSLTNTWNVFTQNLAKSTEGRIAGNIIDNFNDDLRQSQSLITAIILGLGRLQRGDVVVEQGIFQAAGPKRSLGFKEPPPGIPPPGPKEPKGPRAPHESKSDELAKALQAAKDQLRPEKIKEMFDSMSDISKTLNDVTREAAKIPPELKETLFEKFNKLGLGGVFALPGVAAPPTTAGPIPGSRIPVPLAPGDILGPREERIQKALGGIFEDFVFQITTARSTIGDAFKGLLLGITDTFAAEFAKSVQESLQTSFIKPLASWLEDALKSIFEGIDLKGVSKFFLTLGKSFVGLFAEGGTIPPGHWGIAGERGAEVVYSGSQSMHIQPMGGGGHITMNFAISTATGEVSQRTQDQIADSAARGIERAQRLRGAR